MAAAAARETFEVLSSVKRILGPICLGKIMNYTQRQWREMGQRMRWDQRAEWRRLEPGEGRSVDDQACYMQITVQ